MENTERHRCFWVNVKNPLYIQYHDTEWGVPQHSDKKLWELLMLESFQAGLSWECILNKREGFRKAFDEFDVEKISGYGEEKYLRLLADPNIIRNKLKIKACITNSRIFRKIQEEYGSFEKERNEIRWYGHYIFVFAGNWDTECTYERL